MTGRARKKRNTTTINEPLIAPNSPLDRIKGSISIAKGWMLRRSMELFEPLINLSKSNSFSQSTFTTPEKRNSDDFAIKRAVSEPNIRLYATRKRSRTSDQDGLFQPASVKTIKLNDFEEELVQFYNKHKSKKLIKVERYKPDDYLAIHKKYELVEKKTVKREWERMIYEMNKEKKSV
jgi:hypothetical protein